MNISTDSILERAQRLIAIPSTVDKPDELHKALAVLEERLQEVDGLKIEHFEQGGKPSLLAYSGTTRPEKFDILLNGHVDVVPAPPEMFKPRLADNRLYGRGALDMKTAATALTEVFAVMAPDSKKVIGLQLVADEEVSGKDGTGYQVNQGVKADFMLAGEFTPPAAICTESRGICWVKVNFTGTAAHSAYLWQGQNAILLSNTYIEKLLQHYPIPDQDKWITTANVASLTTDNITLNKVPEKAELLLDIRYVAQDPIFKSKQTATDFLQSLDPAAGITISDFEPSHYADSNDAMVQKLAKAASQAYGQPATFIKKHGAADIRYYSAAGSTAVAYGLSGEGLHADNEFLDVSSLEPYAQSLAALLGDD